MMFSRSQAPSAVLNCPTRCKDAKGKDAALVKSTRQRAKAVAATRKPGQPPTPCQQQAAAMGGVTARFQRYDAALPGARAAQDLNALGDKNDAPVKQPCLTRLPMNAAQLNKALNIDPKSPGAITPDDLRKDEFGYRSALYRDESTGRVILVSRDTEPHSLVDWKTNIENGAGKRTEQYNAVSGLSQKLYRDGVQFDAAGYSKGGGLAQEAGLASPGSRVFVFNSAGLPDQSLAKAAASSSASLAARTSSFSAQGDFLTFMNNTTDPGQKAVNAAFLRDQLAGPSGWGLAALKHPMRIDYLNPADQSGTSQEYEDARKSFFQELDKMIADKKVDFPPVRAATREDIPNSMGTASRMLSAGSDQPNLGKLKQHLIENVVGPDAAHPGPMEKQMEADREAMRAFRRSCG